MKIFAVSGSPRKKNNTAALIKEALKGVASVNPKAETETIHLYDLQYSGCISCFSCKKLGGKHYGQCKVKDDLKPVLGVLAQADGLILASPLYFAGLTGEMRSFMERLLFPYFVYDAEHSSLAPKRIPIAFIYNMGAPEHIMLDRKYPESLSRLEFFIEKVYTKPKVMYSCDTYQFDDYSKYKSDCFSEQAKAKHRAEQFPKDLKAAFDLGVAVASEAK